MIIAQKITRNQSCMIELIIGFLHDTNTKLLFYEKILSHHDKTIRDFFLFRYPHILKNYFQVVAIKHQTINWP